MKQKEITEIAVTIILVVVLLSTVGSAVKKVKQRKNPAVKIAPSIDASQVTVPPAGDSYKMQIEEAKNMELKRDPFTNAPIESKEKTSGGVYLSGILWDAAKPLAVVNDRIVKAGDVVGGNKIIEIKPDRLILSDGVKEYEIKLDR